MNARREHSSPSYGVIVRRRPRAGAPAALLVMFSGLVVRAAPPAEWPSLRSEPKSADSAAIEPLSAEVMDVHGRVLQAPPGVLATTSEGWTQVRKGDRLSPGTQIRTSLRSRVDLKFADHTYVSIDRLTLACVSEFHRRNGVDHINLGLGYGAIRGGTSEGRIRSELTVESPVATLAKEGTRDWEITVEAQTGRFTIGLTHEGLVDAIRKVREGRSVHRFVRPGEYADQDNIALMWLHQAEFDRAFKFYGTHGLSKADVGFVAANPTGLASLAPGAGSEFASLAQRLPPRITDVTLPPRVITPATLPRPEGNYGVADTKSRN